MKKAMDDGVSAVLKLMDRQERLARELGMDVPSVVSGLPESRLNRAFNKVVWPQRFRTAFNLVATLVIVPVAVDLVHDVLLKPATSETLISAFDVLVRTAAAWGCNLVCEKFIQEPLKDGVTFEIRDNLAKGP